MKGITVYLHEIKYLNGEQDNEAHGLQQRDDDPGELG